MNLTSALQISYPEPQSIANSPFLLLEPALIQKVVLGHTEIMSALQTRGSLLIIVSNKTGHMVLEIYVKPSLNEYYIILQIESYAWQATTFTFKLFAKKNKNWLTDQMMDDR